MNTIFMSAILTTVVSSSLSAMAATDIEKELTAIDYTKGTVMAITERGPHAVDTAHLLAIQSILHPAYKPEFMALENAELAQAEAKYHLTSIDLPVFIFVDNKGVEVGRIVAGPLTTVGRYVANNSAQLP
ncbi:MAG TPA: hypothetical protein VK974_13295 [Methylophilaceae bacterium]|nr:hypothetical protein [Methylophilaceae bacterium]